MTNTITDSASVFGSSLIEINVVNGEVIVNEIPHDEWMKSIKDEAIEEIKLQPYFRGNKQ